GRAEADVGAHQLLEAVTARLTDELVDRHRVDGSSGPRPRRGPFGPQIGAIRRPAGRNAAGLAARGALDTSARAAAGRGVGPTKHRNLFHLVLEQTTVWYLRCGTWNGMTSPPP